MASSELVMFALSWPGMVGMLSTLVILCYSKSNHTWGCGSSRLNSPPPFRIIKLVDSMKSSIAFFFMYFEQCLGELKQPVH